MRTRPPLVVRLFVAAATMLAATATSAAQVAVIVGGEADHETRARMLAAANQTLLDNAQEPSAQALKPKEIDGVLRCITSVTSKDCAAAFMARTSAARAIVIQVGRDGPDKTAPIVVTGWVVAKVGSELAMRNRFCEPCSPAKLEEASGQLVADLLREVEARTTKTWLLVSTSPQGAEVEVDGKLIGRSELKYGVLAGPHRIVVQLRGYEMATREVTAVAGETVMVDVKLKPQPASPPAQKTQPKVTDGERSMARRWAPWIVAGTGVAISAAGVTLLIRDEDARAPDGALRYEYRENTTLGIVVTSVGATAIGAGVLWYILDRGGSERRSGPTVRVDPSGGVIGYAGTF